VRTWPGLAAIGAGLIHLGSSVGAAPLALTPLFFVGVGEVLWGVLALSRAAPPHAAEAATGVAAVLVGTVVALLLPPSAARHGAPVALGVPPSAFAAAGVLDLALGVLLAVHLARAGRVRPDSRPLRFVLEAAAAAAVVAVLVTQGLAATSVGGSAPMRMH
jgi:hypothetical protein